jgi:hypothetical protein
VLRNLECSDSESVDGEGLFVFLDVVADERQSHDLCAAYWVRRTWRSAALAEHPVYPQDPFPMGFLASFFFFASTKVENSSGSLGRSRQLLLLILHVGQLSGDS